MGACHCQLGGGCMAGTLCVKKGVAARHAEPPHSSSCQQPSAPPPPPLPSPHPTPPTYPFAERRRQPALDAAVRARDVQAERAEDRQGRCPPLQVPVLPPGGHPWAVPRADLPRLRVTPALVCRSAAVHVWRPAVVPRGGGGCTAAAVPSSALYITSNCRRCTVVARLPTGGRAPVNKPQPAGPVPNPRLAKACGQASSGTAHSCPPAGCPHAWLPQL